MVQGWSVAEAVRSIGMKQFTYHRWQKEFGGLKTNQVKRLKQLEKENERLLKAFSDLMLEKIILKKATSGVEGGPVQPWTGGAPETPLVQGSCHRPSI